MQLINLHIHNLRNLREIRLETGPKFNLLFGANGSGKTSFLEAIYYLGTGRSFRTRLHSRLINHEADAFSLFGQLQHEQQVIPIGIERQKDNELKIRFANQNVRSLVDVAQIMPLQIVNPDSRLLLTSGPKTRRQFIDWGVFHVEPLFLKHWQHAQRAIKQRNAAIKSSRKHDLIQLWDNELCMAAQMLDIMRRDYIEQFSHVFSDLIHQWFGIQEPVQLRYKQGWDEHSSLIEVLNRSIDRDIHLGYTQYGPHRADLAIRVNGVPAQDYLSQGQQKLTVYALHLAQGILLRKQNARRCIYLMDDLAAELDENKRQRVISILQEIDAQVFITGVEDNFIRHIVAPESLKLFHVEQGHIELVP